jgi:hypothetical protein
MRKRHGDRSNLLQQEEEIAKAPKKAFEKTG